MCIRTAGRCTHLCATAVYDTLANLVLLLHTTIVLFVVAGLVLIAAGNAAGWRWVNGWWFRGLHVAAIATVVAQSWAGITCPLTTLESWLRRQAGSAAYDTGFIEHWLHRLLYYEAPGWVFTIVYSLFGMLVVASWWRFPPTARIPGRSTPALHAHPTRPMPHALGQADETATGASRGAWAGTGALADQGAAQTPGRSLGFDAPRRTAGLDKPL
jgi:hypothetical protein